MARRYPPEFRRKVLDLLKAGRSVATCRGGSGSERPDDLQLAEPGVDRHGATPGRFEQRPCGTHRSPEENRAARSRGGGVRRAVELLKEAVPPKGGSRRSG